ncbi:MAG: phosphate ABC transporter permease PstA [Desulfohalobiaceae bacterium]|nr:phosphate ABC transporter permease PstA [Desulfohalobiaceae bacterium]
MNNSKASLPSKRLQKRYKAEKRFKRYCITALLLAISFLVVFFLTLISKGAGAFRQAEILTEIAFHEQSRQMPLAAVNEDLRHLVSRGWLRKVPIMLKENPKLMDTVQTYWVVADAEVDQYLKGKPNKLRPRQKKVVERLKEEGRGKLNFNVYFFLNGDSKMPEIAGIKSALVGTLYVLFLTLLFCFPIGVMTAVYLEEFAPDNRFTQAIEININNLAAIPSILYGLLGLAIFINTFHVPRSSALAGGLTLGLMTLPVIIISTRAAIRAVPDSIREAALGVGASRWQVVLHHVLPLSFPGILTGTIIGLAQAMGETAPLLIVGMMAFIPDVPGSFTQAATVLPAQIYTWSSSSLRPFEERTAAAILVLLVVLLLMNALAVFLRQKFQRKW